MGAVLEMRADRVAVVRFDGASITDFALSLAEMPTARTDAARIDRIRVLEDLKSACVAAQARTAAEFAASQRAKAVSGSGAGASRGGVERDALRAVPVGEMSQGLSHGRQSAEVRQKALRLAHRSAAAQVALARRESPTRGGRYVGLAEILVHEMPLMLAALEVGVLNERRAEIIARETACLSRAQRLAVDNEIAGQLDGLGDRALETLVRSIAYRLEPEAATVRSDRAARDRRVSIRPAPDTMAYLTLLLPLASAVACFGAIQAAADSHTGGDARSRGQRMADIAVSALMGADGGADAATVGAKASSSAAPIGTRPVATLEVRSSRIDPVNAVRTAYEDFRAGLGKHRSPPDGSGPRPPGEPPEEPRGAPPPAPVGQNFPPGVGVVLNLVISDRTLFADGDAPARLPGNLPLPAPLARRMLTDLPRDAKVWIRRLYTHPDTGALVSMDSRRRIFPPAMRELLFLRDQDTCRTPWCSAPARHADHVQPHTDGGRTSIANGQSLSEDCNYIRTAPGWQGRCNPGGTITITTPTGHNYYSVTRR